MKHFAYLRDPLFLLSCLLYVGNRWLVKPHLHSAFLTGQFNDLLLIPGGLPPVLWLQRRLGLRRQVGPPTLGEIGMHLVLWSVLLEGVGPHLWPVTGDPLDVAAYAFGAAMAWCVWRWPSPGRLPSSWRRA